MGLPQLKHDHFTRGVAAEVGGEIESLNGLGVRQIFAYAQRLWLPLLTKEGIKGRLRMVRGHPPFCGATPPSKGRPGLHPRSLAMRSQLGLSHSN